MDMTIIITIQVVAFCLLLLKVRSEIKEKKEKEVKNFKQQMFKKTIFFVKELRNESLRNGFKIDPTIVHDIHVQFMNCANNDEWNDLAHSYCVKYQLEELSPMYEPKIILKKQHLGLVK